jgi:uncharacterized membrane protein YpjA
LIFLASGAGLCSSPSAFLLLLLVLSVVAVLVDKDKQSFVALAFLLSTVLPSNE